MEFSGRLASFPVPELLNWASNERRSGSLSIRRASREKRIYFQNGQVVACLSDDPSEFYGQHLLLNGLLDEAQLVHSLSLCRAEKKRLGIVLSEQGILSLEVIQRTLRHLIEDRVCDLFLWNHGLFFFQVEDPPEEEILAEPIETMALILEGSRWIDEKRRIEKVLAHDHLVLSRSGGWPGEELIPLQKRLAEEVDGEATLAEIYRRINGSYFQFLLAAYHLHQNGIVEVSGERESPAASMELHITDLLLEQAAEEQILHSRRHLALPIDVVDKYVPVWVRRPSAEELEEASERERLFYSRLDGSRRLDEILSKDEAERNRQSELLLLQMRKATIALLPVSIAELEDHPESTPWWRRLLAR